MGKRMKVINWSLPYLSLLKLRIVALLVAVAMVAAIVAGSGNFLLSQLILLALAGGLGCAGSSVLNNYLDRDIDAMMPRTRNRALVTKRADPAKVLALGVSLLTVSLVVALQLGYLVSLSLALGALIYVVLYTIWLKRRTPLNIVIGGLSGSCAVLAGWFTMTSELSPTPFLIASTVFLWTPSHFWSFALAHQESYQKARVPMLPTVIGVKKTAAFITLHSALVILTALSLYFISPLSEVYLIGALLLGILFLASSLWLWKRPNTYRAWRHYKFSGIYLLGLFLLMALDILG